ncbi:PREDICTED: protein BPS1, chloroplastic-like [Tarenaya hassleriana]|uniref:protein BPS1, chloroplastic-like n=1 Tax=Tarenaya hassleriana TaxID=28532 RepID=UPI00053C9CD5|nr:PREDICTED: protein BPS1, chloroplastic-like [Tarenaya hassleriana]
MFFGGVNRCEVIWVKTPSLPPLVFPASDRYFKEPKDLSVNFLSDFSISDHVLRISESFRMSRPQDPPRGFFPFGNPFRMLSPKGSDLSPWLLSLLNTFESVLSERLKKLMPKNKDDILTISWMKLAMESLRETHSDIKIIITDLQLPVSDWEDKWIDVYLDISVKLLDLCNTFSSELTRLNQGNLFLQCAKHSLESLCAEKYVRARSSLDSWRQHVFAKNPRIENCRAVLHCLLESLNMPKVKNSAKGKVLMQALYGVKVHTVYICSVFVTGFSGSTEDLLALSVSDKPLWAKAFSDLQTAVNADIGNIVSSGGSTVLKELDAIDGNVKKLYPMIQEGMSPIEVEPFEESVLELGKNAEGFSQGLDWLTEEVDEFFNIILSGRDALLSNLRSTDSGSNSAVGRNLEQAVS